MAFPGMNNRPKPKPSAKPSSMAGFGMPNVGGGGGGARNNFGGGFSMPGGGGPRANLPKPKPAGAAGAPAGPPAPGIPDIEAYLAGDQMYQSGISELMRALGLFNAQAGHQRGTINSAFDTAMSRMGAERDRSLKTIEDDFASRGLVNSGLYGKARDDYNTEYNSRVGDLNFDRQNELNALGFEEQNFSGLNQSEAARLRQEAIARRAERYNVF